MQYHASHDLRNEPGGTVARGRSLSRRSDLYGTGGVASENTSCGQSRERRAGIGGRGPTRIGWDSGKEEERSRGLGRGGTTDGSGRSGKVMVVTRLEELMTFGGGILVNSPRRLSSVLLVPLDDVVMDAIL